MEITVAATYENLNAVPGHPLHASCSGPKAHKLHLLYAVIGMEDESCDGWMQQSI